jgi:phosphate starvation-inducible PhoH-like protein
LTETIINLETVNPIEFFGVNNGKLDILKKNSRFSKSFLVANRSSFQELLNRLRMPKRRLSLLCPTWRGTDT